MKNFNLLTVERSAKENAINLEHLMGFSVILLSVLFISVHFWLISHRESIIKNIKKLEQYLLNIPILFEKNDKLDLQIEHTEHKQFHFVKMLANLSILNQYSLCAMHWTKQQVQYYLQGKGVDNKHLSALLLNASFSQLFTEIHLDQLFQITPQELTFSLKLIATE